MARQIPQNVKRLVEKIGENQVLLRLAILTHKNPKWEVFSNICNEGYDILLMSHDNNIKIRIEVKARQQIFTTGKENRSVQFNMTNKEYESSDFLIGYFIDLDKFYIIPKTVLKPVNNKKTWRYNLTRRADGTPHPIHGKYENKWNLLHPKLVE